MCPQIDDFSVCAPSEDTDHVISALFPLVSLFLYSGLPALILLVLNGLLARVLHRSRKSLLSQGGSTQQWGHGHTVTVRSTISLLHQGSQI